MKITKVVGKESYIELENTLGKTRMDRHRLRAIIKEIWKSSASDEMFDVHMMTKYNLSGEDYARVTSYFEYLIEQIIEKIGF